MVDPLPIDPKHVAGLDSLGGKPPAQRSGVEQSASVEFRAMLERLETRASDLAAKTEQVDGPDQLGRAVDSARASLEEALTLKDQLLEAYRQAEQQDAANRGREAS